MIGIFRMCFQNLIRLLAVLRPSHKRSIYFLAFVVSLLLLVVYISYSINKASANTPTPTPEPPAEPSYYYLIGYEDRPLESDYLECLIGRGSIGYSNTYTFIPQGDYTNGDIMCTFYNSGVQGSSWIEFTTLSIPYIPTDNWRCEFWLSAENGYFVPSSINLGGETITDTVVSIGQNAIMAVQYDSTENVCKIIFAGSGPLGDIDTTGFQNLIFNQYITINGEFHVSSPTQFSLTYYGFMFDDIVPTVPPEPPTVTPFPDHSNDETVAPDTPNYNGILSGIGNSIQWLQDTVVNVSNNIVGAINNLFGDPSDIIAELGNIENAFLPIQYLILGGEDEQGNEHIGLFTLGLSAWDRLYQMPSSAVLDFTGLQMDVVTVGNYIPSWITIGSGYNHGPNTHESIVFGQGSYIIPSIHIDFGSMFNQMGLTGWIHLVVRLIAYGCVASYMWSLYQRSLHLVTGDTVKGLITIRNNTM